MVQPAMGNVEVACRPRHLERWTANAVPNLPGWDNARSLSGLQGQRSKSTDVILGNRAFTCAIIVIPRR